MLESVANLKKTAKKGQTAENTAFQQLFLLVGMHLFKVRLTTRAMMMLLCNYCSLDVDVCKDQTLAWKRSVRTRS